MLIKTIRASSIITKSRLPGVDFVINPYIGCQHGCIYCYADFMKRFTNHNREVWGEFVDIKDFDLSDLKPERYDNSSILVSSVTDPYQSVEAKHKLTRLILEKLSTTHGEVSILTKSALVLRDIDTFKKFENISIGISLSVLDREISKKLEPFASPPTARVGALKKLHENGLKTYLFMSPIFPGITDFRMIIDLTKDFVDTYWFENINIRPNNISRITKFIMENKPEFLGVYKNLDRKYWDELEKDIKSYCSGNNIKYNIVFHHGK